MKKKKLVTSDLIGGGVKVECSCCFKYFSTQGFPNHEKHHKSFGHKLGTKPQTGKAKTTGAKCDEPVICEGKKETVDLTKNPTTTFDLVGRIPRCTRREQNFDTDENDEHLCDTQML